MSHTAPTTIEDRLFGAITVRGPKHQAGEGHRSTGTPRRVTRASSPNKP